MSNAADITEAERRYQQIKDKLSAAEQRGLAEQKARYEQGDRHNSYGHDLFSAVQRGHLNHAQEKLNEAIDALTQDGSPWMGDPESGALYLLCKTFAQRGVTAERIRAMMERRLDGDAIERMVAREA